MTTNDEYDLEAIRNLVESQFAALAWNGEQGSDWQTFGRGFTPEAKLFPAKRPVAAITTDQFAARMMALRSKGKLHSFRESLTQFRCLLFGNVAVAMAGCEMLENEDVLTKDVSAFLFVKDADAWRVAAQAWDIDPDNDPRNWIEC